MSGAEIVDSFEYLGTWLGRDVVKKCFRKYVEKHLSACSFIECLGAGHFTTGKLLKCLGSSVLAWPASLHEVPKEAASAYSLGLQRVRSLPWQSLVVFHAPIFRTYDLIWSCHGAVRSPDPLCCLSSSSCQRHQWGVSSTC